MIRNTYMGKRSDRGTVRRGFGIRGGERGEVEEGREQRGVVAVTYLMLISPGEETCKWRGRVALICMWIIMFLSPESPACLIGVDGQVNVCDWLEWLRCGTRIMCFRSSVAL